MKTPVAVGVPMSPPPTLDCAQIFPIRPLVRAGRSAERERGSFVDMAARRSPPQHQRRSAESLRRRAQQRPRGRDTRLDIIIGAGAGRCRGQHELDAVSPATSARGAPGMVAAGAMSAMSGAAMGTAASVPVGA